MFERIKEIIQDQLGVANLDNLTVDSSLTEDLDADSLDAVEIIMAIEEEFDVEIPDNAAEIFETIGDIMDYIESHQ